jgi:hypothetical protein
MKCNQLVWETPIRASTDCGPKISLDTYCTRDLELKLSKTRAGGGRQMFGNNVGWQGSAGLWADQAEASLPFPCVA